MMVYKRISDKGAELFPFGGIGRKDKDVVETISENPPETKTIKGITAVLNTSGAYMFYLKLTDAEHTALVSKIESSSFSGVIFTVDITGETPVIS